MVIAVIRRARKQRRGQTLLELVAAGTIIATTLTPALRLMRDSLSINRELEIVNLLSSLCVSKLEETLAATAGNWQTADVSGDFTSQGYANCRFLVMRRDGAVEGGIPNRLLALTAEAWEDANNNGLWDTGEKRVRYATKLSRTVSYDYEARGM